ncbi:MAG: hypothetical protein ACFFDN_45790 [Candidatus Hodarchaeota archaeon]
MNIKKIEEIVECFNKFKEIKEILKNIEILKKKGTKPFMVAIIDNEGENIVDIFDEKDTNNIIDYIKNYYEKKKKDLIENLNKID